MPRTCMHGSTQTSVTQSDWCSELGFICHFMLKQNNKRDLRLQGQEDKFWEGDQEKYGKEGLLSKICYADLSLDFIIDKSC